MALIKSVDYKGRPAEYWRILQYNSSFMRDDIVVTLGLYFDQDARVENPDAVLDTRQMQMSYAMFEEPVSVTGANRDVLLSISYGAIMFLAAIEAQKPTEERDEQFAFWIDAIRQP